MLFLNPSSVVFLTLIATGSCFINAIVDEPLKLVYSLLGGGGRAAEPPTLTARPSMPLNSARSLNPARPTPATGPAPSVQSMNDVYPASNWRQLPARTWRSNVIVMPLNTDRNSGNLRSGANNRRVQVLPYADNAWMVQELSQDPDWSSSSSSSEEDWGQSGRMPVVTPLGSGPGNRGASSDGIIMVQPALQLRAQPKWRRPFQW